MILYGKLMSLADFQYWIIPESVMGGTAGGTEEIVWRKAEKAEILNSGFYKFILDGQTQIGFINKCARKTK